MKILWFLFVFCVLHEQSEANMWDPPSIPENRTEVIQLWKAMDSGVKGIVKSIMKTAMPIALKATSELNISSQCVKESLQLVSGLRNLKMWAFRFVDSSAKMVDGTITGTISFLGEYEECINTLVPNPRRSNETLFRGQYCTAEMRPPLPYKQRRYGLYDHVEALDNFTGSEVFNFLKSKAHVFYFLPYKVGLCIPSGCSENDLLQLLQYAGEKTHLDMKVAHCETKEPKKIRKVQVAAITVTCILGALVLLGTFLEVFFNSQEVPFKNLICRILVCFSLVSNFKRLASTKRSAGNLHCLHGFRFLSITWVVMGHAYFYPAWFIRSYKNIFNTQKMASEPVAQAILNGSEAVDSFILLSGILLGYLTVKHVIVDKKSFSIKTFIFHRLWRIIPVYYFIILFAMLTPLMGSGPLFHETMEESIYPCFNYWWRNLLFINSYFHIKDVCMMHTWYVSVDMQLYFASLLVLLPMFKYEKIGVAINVMIIFISVIYSGVIAYLKRAISTITISHFDPVDRNIGYLYLYANTLSRAGPFFIGTLLGYILAKKPTFKMSKCVQVAGWCCAVLSSGCTIFLLYHWHEGDGPAFLDTVMYATFYKVAYSSGVAWMIFCCVTGHGGWINTFLSWKAWVPLSKLCFLIFLIQPIFQTLYIANYTSTQDQSHLIAIIHFFGFLCISGLLAMVCNLLVESPFLAMEKVMRPEKSEKEKVATMGDINHGMSVSNDNFHTVNGKFMDDGIILNGASTQFTDVSKF